jgi:hypothetical protein
MGKKPTPRNRRGKTQSTPSQPPGTGGRSPDDDSKAEGFNPKDLDKTLISLPLIEILAREKEELKQSPTQAPKVHPVIIDLNLEYPGGRSEARKAVEAAIEKFRQELSPSPPEEGVSQTKNKLGQQYLFAELRGSVIEMLAAGDEEDRRTAGSAMALVGRVAQMAPGRAIFHIWPDFEVEPLDAITPEMWCLAVPRVRHFSKKALKNNGQRIV